MNGKRKAAWAKRNPIARRKEGHISLREAPKPMIEPVSAFTRPRLTDRTRSRPKVAWLSRDTLYVPETLGLLLVLSVSLGLVNADTGSIIGFGASRKEMWPSFLRAIGFRFAHAAFLFPFILRVDEPFSAISAATSAGFALLVYYYVYHRILPGTLPEDLRRELRRDRRRAFTPRG